MRLCGLELFASSGKYDSGCGWPAFHTELTMLILLESTIIPMDARRN